MRRLLLLPVVIVAAIAVSAAGATTTVVEEQVATAFPVCVNGVLGDLAYGTVTRHTVTVDVVNKNRVNYRAILTEEGELDSLLYPGTKYQYSLTWPIIYNYSTTVGEQASQTAFMTATVVGPGGEGNTTVVRLSFYGRINGNGEVVVERTEPLTTVCV